MGRPVGAAVFGHYGDKLGRRKVTIISMGGFAVVTLLIGFLPGYESWGIASIVILTLLRFVDGVFLGGEYTGANPLAMEYAPKEKRGERAAFIHTGFPLSVAAMSLITAALLHVLPRDRPTHRTCDGAGAFRSSWERCLPAESFGTTSRKFRNPAFGPKQKKLNLR